MRRIKTQVIVIIGTRVLMTVTTEVTEETEGESQFSVLPIPLTPQGLGVSRRVRGKTEKWDSQMIVNVV